MRSVLYSILLGCGLTALTAQAVPMVLYDNGTPVGTATDNTGQSYFNGDFAGDDFPLATSSTVTGLQFYGFGRSPVTALDYYIYTAAGSLPGTLLESGAAVNLSTVPDGRAAGYLATFDLVSALALDPGRYFVVLGLGTPGYPGYQVVDIITGFAHGTSPGVISHNNGDAPGQFSSGDADLSFRILGTPGVTPAPEPSGFLLSGSMIGGVLLLARKRLRRSAAD